jgi:hypothetical protein
MGRVYAIDPDLSKGERSGHGYRAFSHPIQYVFFYGAFRIEFDEDKDEGMATITGHYPCHQIVDGRLSDTVFVADVLTNEPIRYTVRGYCRMRPKANPTPDPNWCVDSRGRVCPAALENVPYADDPVIASNK